MTFRVELSQGDWLHETVIRSCRIQGPATLELRFRRAWVGSMHQPCHWVNHAKPASRV